MSDPSLLFKPELILANNSGQKLETRRIITKQPALNALDVFGPDHLLLSGNRDLLPINAVKGTLVWVKENYRLWDNWDHAPAKTLFNNASSYDEWEHFDALSVFYEADGVWFSDERGEPETFGKLRPSIFMMKEFSRTTLKITNIRIQRIRDISLEDVKKEGVSSRKEFLELWDRINAPRGHAWHTNPWVAAYTYEAIQTNILELTNVRAV